MMDTSGFVVSGGSGTPPSSTSPGGQNKPRPIYPPNPQSYNLHALIGKEPKATIWMGEVKDSKEQIAIKIIDLENLDGKTLEGLKKRLQKNEFSNHPNIVNYLCSFCDGNNLWVIMNYLAGGCCQDIINCSFPNGFEEPIILCILVQVLNGLEFFHRSGRIHRDLRASRIYLEADGSIRLSDSNISTFEVKQQHQTLAGSPSWTAPEVFSNQGYDCRADIWSFGITALELAQGHPPFANYPPLKRVMLTLESDPPKLEPKYESRFSEAFKDLVASCLQKDPARRPTASQLLQHPVFKNVPPKKFLMEKLLGNLPSLEQRFKVQMQSGQIASLNNEPFGWMGAQSPHFQMGSKDPNASQDPPASGDSMEPPGTPNFHPNDTSSPPGSTITSPEHPMSRMDSGDRERGGSGIQVGRFKVTTSTLKNEDRPRSGSSIHSFSSSSKLLPTHSAIPMEEEGTNVRNTSSPAPGGGVEQQLAFLVQQSQMQQKMLAQLLDQKQGAGGGFLGFGGSSLPDSSERENPMQVITHLERLVTKLMKENEELRSEVTRLKQLGYGERTEEERKRDLLVALQNWKTQPHDVIRLVGDGIPDAMKGSVWQLLTQSIELYNMNKNYYEDMKDRESNFAEAITCDAPRTVIAADPSKQKSLTNILMVYSIYDLDTGYCQGMNYIVALLLEFMPEENAFWMFVRLMKSYCIKGFFQQNSTFLLECMEVFDQNLQTQAPKAAEYLKKYQISATLYASKWFTTLFFYPGIPAQLCYRIFDLFCIDGLDILFRVGIALIVLSQDAILGVTGFMELTNYLLTTMPSNFPVEVVIRKAKTLNLSIPYLSTTPIKAQPSSS